jgi:hypothetical protein
VQPDRDIGFLGVWPVDAAVGSWGRCQVTIIRVRKIVVRVAVTMLVGIFALAFSPGLAAANLPPNGEGVPPLAFQGGWVQYHPKVYLVFWGPKWNEAPHAAAKAEVEKVFDNLAGSAYNNVLRQYNNQSDDPNGYVHNDVSHEGTWVDSDPPPDGLLMGLENVPVATSLEAEAIRAVDHWRFDRDSEGRLKPDSELKNFQVLIFPQQGSTYAPLTIPLASGPVEIPIDACGMHSYSPAKKLAYAYVRYSSDLGCDKTGTGDVGKDIAVSATHEYAEMATDPHLYLPLNPVGGGSGWPVHGSGWNTNEIALTPQEISDICETYRAGTYSLPPGPGPGSLTVPYQWDNAFNSCTLAVGKSFWSPDNTAVYHHKHTVQGAILDHYQNNVALLGDPLTEEIPIPGGAVTYFADQAACAGGYTVPSDTQNGGGGMVASGGIYWSNQSGAHEVHGCIFQKYAESHGPDGPLGFPLSDEYAIVGGRQSDFQNGYITFDNSTGQTEVHIGGGEPTVIRNRDGRLEVFEWRSDHTIWHKWQTTANGSWSGWESLGSSLAGRPAAALNEDGRLEIFARGTDGALWHNWQTSAGGNWSGWYSLGGTFRQNPAATWTVSGRLEVFVRGTDDLYYYNRQTSPGGGWSGWSAIGTCCGHSNPGVVLDTFGQPHVFMTEANGVVWTKWQFSNGNWSGWDTLGCCAKSEPVLGRNYNGTLEVFIRGTDDQLYHKWETSRGGSWSGWAGLSGALTSTPTAAINITVGTLEVFVRGTGNGVWHMWQGSPSGNWSGWAGLGGGLTSGPVVFPNYDGRLEVFARGTDGNLYHCWQTTPAGGWTGWSIL